MLTITLIVIIFPVCFTDITMDTLYSGIVLHHKTTQICVFGEIIYEWITILVHSLLSGYIYMYWMIVTEADWD